MTTAPHINQGANDMDLDRNALAGAIKALRRDHVTVADNFYSCPKSESGCDDPAWGPDECSCGADEHNARVDSLIAQLTGSDRP